MVTNLHIFDGGQKHTLRLHLLLKAWSKINFPLYNRLKAELGMPGPYYMVALDSPTLAKSIFLSACPHLAQGFNQYFWPCVKLFPSLRLCTSLAVLQSSSDMRQAKIF